MLFPKIDRNGDGLLTKIEFLSFSEMSKEHSSRMFDKMDRDRDGYVDPMEAAHGWGTFKGAKEEGLVDKNPDKCEMPDGSTIKVTPEMKKTVKDYEKEKARAIKNGEPVPPMP